MPTGALLSSRRLTRFCDRQMGNVGLSPARRPDRRSAAAPRGRAVACNRHARAAEPRPCATIPRPRWCRQRLDRGRHLSTGVDDQHPEEARRHAVTVDGFWIDRHEVTNAQFARFVDATGYRTLAERGLDPKAYPGPAAGAPAAWLDGLRPPEPLTEPKDITQWWRYVPAPTAAPGGSGEPIEGKGELPGGARRVRGCSGLRTVGRAAPADRGGMGVRGARRWGAAAVMTRGELLSSLGWKANSWQGPFPRPGRGSGRAITAARRSRLRALAGRSDLPGEPTSQQGAALTPSSAPLRQSANTQASRLAAATPDPAITGGAASPPQTGSVMASRSQPAAVSNAGSSGRQVGAKSTRPAATASLGSSMRRAAPDSNPPPTTTSAGAAGKRAPAAALPSRAPTIEVPICTVRSDNPSRSSGAALCGPPRERTPRTSWPG